MVALAEPLSETTTPALLDTGLIVPEIVAAWETEERKPTTRKRAKVPNKEAADGSNFQDSFS